MVPKRQIEQLAKRVAEAFKPQRIVLFGSYASGAPTPDSDVDLLVVMPHRGPGHRTAAKIRCFCDTGFPIDVLVRSQREIDSRLAMGDPFFQQIMGEGIVLHDAGNP
jgi:predicted nucleotidyltransferase